MVVRMVLSIAATTILLVTAYYLAPLERSSTNVALRVVLAVVAVAAVTAISLVSIGRSEFPIVRAAQGVAIVIVLLLLVFASTYVMMSAATEDAFTESLNHTGALYFSMTTTTTIGYGDIAAKSDTARIIVMVNMVTNVLLLGVTARLLFYTARRRAEQP